MSENNLSDIQMLEKIYVNVAVPFTTFAMSTGFVYGVFDELNEISRRNTALTSFVNVTGLTFIGFCSGFFWPVTMPVISICAIYNKMNMRPRIKHNNE